jgi:hypothetical protein
VIKCFQLWGEMRSPNPHQFALRLEILKLGLAIALLRNSDDRLPDVEFSLSTPPSETEFYTGSRTGTRLPSLTKVMFPGSKRNTQLSDFFHALVPLIYLASSSGWRKSRTKWTSWILATLLEAASILSLPEENQDERRLRIRRLILESVIRQPMFDLVLNPPTQMLSALWNKIPLLREVNYLEYYLYCHRKYFYFHQ